MIKILNKPCILSHVIKCKRKRSWLLFFLSGASWQTYILNSKCSCKKTPHADFLQLTQQIHHSALITMPLTSINLSCNSKMLVLPQANPVSAHLLSWFVLLVRGCFAVCFMVWIFWGDGKLRVTLSFWEGGIRVFF